MNKTKEALKMAIEALKDACGLTPRDAHFCKAINACKEALKPHPDCDEACMFQCQMERKEALVELQEPEYVYVNPITQDMYYLTKTTQPPKREWRGLSDEKIATIWMNEPIPMTGQKFKQVYIAIEQALKEINHD